VVVPLKLSTMEDLLLPVEACNSCNPCEISYAIYETAWWAFVSSLIEARDRDTFSTRGDVSDSETPSGRTSLSTTSKRSPLLV
jgi:hypothetical protein